MAGPAASKHIALLSPIDSKLLSRNVGVYLTVIFIANFKTAANMKCQARLAGWSRISKLNILELIARWICVITLF